MLNTLFSPRQIVHSQRPHHCVKQSGATSKSLAVVVVAGEPTILVTTPLVAVAVVRYQQLLLILGYCRVRSILLLGLRGWAV
jgi:hypothetical protein